MSVVNTNFQLFLVSILLCLCYICDASETDNSSYTYLISQIKDLLASDDKFIELNNAISNISGNGGLENYNLGLSNEDKDLNITQLINKYGYTVEEHNVTTSDGYVLTMHRMPGNKSAMFLMHGLLSSSVDWVTAGPESALPYLLASEGYDVWMGNARGNKYARHHVSLSTDDADFWDFSWDEIGRYDLPAMIDYVLNVTSQPQLKYVGHSQGTTTFFVMCSERPEYNAKISLMVSLSTVAWMSHVESPVPRIVAPFYQVIYSALSAIGVYEINSETPLITTVTRGICGNTVLADLICSNVLYLLTGFNYPQLNLTNAPVIFGHTPGGSSTKQLVHYAQEILSGKFQRYDYGSLKNVVKYGSVDPPDYPVQNITAPMVIFYSPAMDWFSNLEDLKIFNKSVSVAELYEVPTDAFSHTDFIWAKDVKKLVYAKILELLPKEFNNYSD